MENENPNSISKESLMNEMMFQKKRIMVTGGVGVLFFALTFAFLVIFVPAAIVTVLIAAYFIFQLLGSLKKLQIIKTMLHQKMITEPNSLSSQPEQPNSL
jgi:hypothetical protein